MDKSEISKFFDEEPSGTEKSMFPSVIDPETVEMNKLGSGIANEALSRIYDDPKKSSIWFSKVSELVEILKLPDYAQRLIFTKIRVGLPLLPKRKKAEILADFFEKNKISENEVVMSAKDESELDEHIKIIEHSFNVVISHFERTLRENYKSAVEKYINGCDLPEKIKRIDKLIAVVPGGYSEYQREVLLKMKADLESDFKIEKEKIERRKQLGIADSPENKLTNLDESKLNGQEKQRDESRSKGKDENRIPANQKQVYFALMTLLIATKNSAIEEKDRYRLMSFLSGYPYTSIETLVQDIKNGKIKEETLEKDVEKVKEIFKNYGSRSLTKNVDELADKLFRKKS